MKQKIMPAVVLTLICAITCGLLVFAYNATYVDNTGVITDKLYTALSDVYGEKDFTMPTTADGSLITADGITSVITDGEGSYAYEITADGYKKGGLHILVALDKNSAVCGVKILDIGETPGLGTKVQDDSFLSQFSGVTADMMTEAPAAQSDTKPEPVWSEDIKLITDLSMEKLYEDTKASNAGGAASIDLITGATYSSTGMKNAVKLAVDTDKKLKGEGLI